MPAPTPPLPPFPAPAPAPAPGLLRLNLRWEGKTLKMEPPVLHGYEVRFYAADGTTVVLQAPTTLPEYPVNNPLPTIKGGRVDVIGFDNTGAAVASGTIPIPAEWYLPWWNKAWNIIPVQVPFFLVVLVLGGAGWFAYQADTRVPAVTPDTATIAAVLAEMKSSAATNAAAMSALRQEIESLKASKLTAAPPVAPATPPATAASAVPSTIAPSATPTPSVLPAVPTTATPPSATSTPIAPSASMPDVVTVKPPTNAGVGINTVQVARDFNISLNGGKIEIADLVTSELRKPAKVVKIPPPASGTIKWEFEEYVPPGNGTYFEFPAGWTVHVLPREPRGSYSCEINVGTPDKPIWEKSSLDGSADPVSAHGYWYRSFNGVNLKFTVTP